MPHEIDIRVGEKIVEARKMAGISQQKLAEHCNVSFQQIQKYERGTNRVSCSRIWEISQFLGVPVSYFFPQTKTDPDVIAISRLRVRLKLAEDKLEHIKSIVTGHLSHE